MNLLIAIGCDRYDFLKPLACAEADARALHDLLTNAGDPYSYDHRILLLSPTAQEVRHALENAFPLKPGCDSVTFFFAGHGGIAGGSFFLCLRDCQGDKLSTTGLPISTLFTIVNDFKPAQVNFVIDACSAGGSSFDLGALIKSEFTGSSTSSSIAFLGACCVDQNALEQGNHGFLTAQLLRTLRGEIEVQRRGPYLDLLEIGAVVSTRVQSANNDQRPLCWGLSLFGGSRFARNPFFSNDNTSQHFPLPDISPFSSFGTKIRQASGELWEIHRELPNDFSPRRLLKWLHPLLSQATSIQEQVALVKGISSSLSARGAESEDLMTPWLCMATCLSALLPYSGSLEMEAYLPELCLGLLDRDASLQAYIDEVSRKEEYFLLSQYAVAGDLYFLPIRLARILGWIGLNILGRRLLGIDSPLTEKLRMLAKHLLERYGSALSATSDAQGAPLYLFFLACRISGWDDLAKSVLTSFYASFCGRNGNTTRCNIPVEQAIRYVLSLTDTRLAPKDWSPANPSHLLPVLIVWGKSFDLSPGWDLRSLDGVSMNFFVPKNPRDFNNQVIEHGMNHVRQIGHGVWQIEAYLAEYHQILSATKTDDLFKLSSTAKFQCLVSSFLFPDRIAFFVDEHNFQLPALAVRQG